jgi:hypothetical protein
LVQAWRGAYPPWSTISGQQALSDEARSGERALQLGDRRLTWLHRARNLGTMMRLVGVHALVSQRVRKLLEAG